MYVRLEPEEVAKVFAIGSSACARSTTVEASASEIERHLERALPSAAGGGTVERTTRGLVVAGGGAFVAEEWSAVTTSYGPKTTVSLGATRMIRRWAILVAWLVVARARANAVADRWTGAAYAQLGHVERELQALTPNAATYRT